MEAPAPSPRKHSHPSEAFVAADGPGVATEGPSTDPVTSNVPNKKVKLAEKETSPRSSIIDLSSLEADEEIQPVPDTAYPTTALPTMLTSTATVVTVVTGNTTAPRYSQRERRSTLVYIEGHAVLAKNNYVLKGDTYSYGAFETQALRPSKLPTQTKPSVPRAPRTVSNAEIKRAAHNDTVRQRILAKAAKRKTFLLENLDVMEPFLDPKTARALKSVPISERAKQINDTMRDVEDYALEQPSGITGTLRDYQMEGLRFMASMYQKNIGCILGDEMGLGKTLQTISLLSYLKETHGLTGPSLVICPLSVVYTWCDELKKWNPDLNFLRLHSSSAEEREAQKRRFLETAYEYDVVVTTYEMAKNPALSSLWSRQHFNYVILDEGHIIKNSDALISLAVRKLHYENALLLTGTPLQNNLTELWSLLNFLLPDVFTSQEPFAQSFDITKKIINKKSLAQAHLLLEVFMLRRMKTEVEKLLPKKIETKLYCPLSKQQCHLYKGLLLKDLDLLAKASDKLRAIESNQALTEISASCGPVYGLARQLDNLLMQLRKCCNHPFLFDGMEEDIDATAMEDLICASGKLAVLDKLLRNLFIGKHRVVLFSQFTSVLDIIEDYCNMRGWNYCRLDGSTSRARRNFLCKDFNRPDSSIFIFLLTTRSGGMGLNLQSADTCVLYDSDWNPQVDIQAMARVHRLGQKNTVHVYRLVTGGSVEERMVERAEKKLFLDKMVNRGKAETGDENKKAALKGSELLSVLRFGCDAVFGEASKSRNKLPTNEEIAILTDRNRSENCTNGELMGGMQQTAASFNAEQELCGLTSFQGMDFKQMREKLSKNRDAHIPKDLRGIALDWESVKNKEKRERKNRIVMMQGNGSGYGAKFVPVLAQNNYEIESGEPSINDRELKDRPSRNAAKKNKEVSMAEQIKPAAKLRTFVNQNFCICCHKKYGELMGCQKCPIAAHEKCLNMRKGFSTTAICSHHRCTDCNRSLSASGGFLFPCQSCPKSYCEDCLPVSGTRLIGVSERLINLGHVGPYVTRNYSYIHCSERCEEIAKREFSWTLLEQNQSTCPPEMDFSHAFCAESKWSNAVFTKNPAKF